MGIDDQIPPGRRPQPPDPGRPATLAHALAVQGVLRSLLVALLEAGVVTRSQVTKILMARAAEMRAMTADPSWLRAAQTVEGWAREVEKLGNFAK